MPPYEEMVDDGVAEWSPHSIPIKFQGLYICTKSILFNISKWNVEAKFQSWNDSTAPIHSFISDGKKIFSDN